MPQAGCLLGRLSLLTGVGAQHTGTEDKTMKSC